MHVYALVLACLLNTDCHPGYLMLNSGTLADCQMVVPAINGRKTKRPDGVTVTWRAEGCVSGNSPPARRQFLGML